MRVPQSWLSELVGELPPVEQTGEAFVRVGFEVEEIHGPPDVSGPVVVGLVREIEELTGLKKPIRWCQVQVGPDRTNGIICGARNFAVGDKVVVVLPGAELPGGFAISARKTYGRNSHGMICSSDELGMGDDGTKGIIVLPPETEVGKDAIELLELVDEVLDIAVTPDRGYCLSIRGVARETAIAYGLPLRDPALLDVPGQAVRREEAGFEVHRAEDLGFVVRRDLVWWVLLGRLIGGRFLRLVRAHWLGRR